MSGNIELSVEEVALKQLESAVWMYAYEFDEVAVHTIAAAAYELLIRRLKLSDYEEKINKYIIDGKEKEFWKLINKPYNFFKHGQHSFKDIEKLEYEAESVEHILLAACYAITFMQKSKQLKCAHSFMVFMMVKNPGMFKDSKLLKEARALNISAAKQNINVADKKVLVGLLGKINSPFLIK